jgi:uncharacterized membrane protein YdbT with pleckstrin-like domain
MAQTSDPQAPGNGETVLWQGAPSQWQNFGWFLSCLLVLPIPVAFWKWLVISNTRITLTKERLRVRTGVFSKQNEDVELYRIKDWTLREPLNQRIFGKGTVLVMSSDRTAPELALTWISKPEDFVENLRRAVESVRDVKRVRELDMGLGDGADVHMD